MAEQTLLCFNCTLFFVCFLCSRGVFGKQGYQCQGELTICFCINRHDLCLNFCTIGANQLCVFLCVHVSVHLCGTQAMPSVCGYSLSTNEETCQGTGNACNSNPKTLS